MFQPALKDIALGLGRRCRFRVTLALAAVLAPLSPAHAADWVLASSRQGTPVARLELSGGPIRAIELACLGSGVALGLQSNGPARLLRFPIVFQGDSGLPVALSAPRMNAGTYAAVLPDWQLVAGLTGGWRSGRIAAGGTPFVLPLDNAAPVLTRALAGCYAPAASPSSARPAPSPAPRGQGVLAKVPFQLGWYVNEGTPCAKAQDYETILFEGDGFWLFGDGAADFQKLDPKTFERDGATYSVLFPAPAEGCEEDDGECPGGVYIAVRDRTHVTWGINGDADVHFCPVDTISTRLRSLTRRR
jgi:hypothetical protein